jgi:hypothetical protein
LGKRKFSTQARLPACIWYIYLTRILLLRYGSSRCHRVVPQPPYSPRKPRYIIFLLPTRFEHETTDLLVHHLTVIPFWRVFLKLKSTVHIGDDSRLYVFHRFVRSFLQFSGRIISASRFEAIDATSCLARQLLLVLHQKRLIKSRIGSISTFVDSWMNLCRFSN